MGLTVEKMKGKWVVNGWKNYLKQKAYLFTWFLKSEMTFDSEMKEHTKVVMECDFQTFMNKMSEDDDIICLTCWEKREIDFEMER